MCEVFFKEKLKQAVEKLVDLSAAKKFENW